MLISWLFSASERTSPDSSIPISAGRSPQHEAFRVQSHSMTRHRRRGPHALGSPGFIELLETAVQLAWSASVASRPSNCRLLSLAAIIGCVVDRIGQGETFW